jgi:arylsulfatase A-like enzyme
MHCVDWFPTIAELAGYRPEAGLKWDGVSQWAAMTGKVGEGPARAIYIAMKGQRSLRAGGWKLIARNKGKTELYHIAADPYETKDLAAAEPAKLGELRAILEAEHAKDDPELPKDLAGLPH